MAEKYVLQTKETEKIMLLHSERINIVARYQNAGIEERPGQPQENRQEKKDEIRAKENPV